MGKASMTDTDCFFATLFSANVLIELLHSVATLLFCLVITRYQFITFVVILFTPCLANLPQKRIVAPLCLKTKRNDNTRLPPAFGPTGLSLNQYLMSYITCRLKYLYTSNWSHMMFHPSHCTSNFPPSKCKLSPEMIIIILLPTCRLWVVSTSQ